MTPRTVAIMIVVALVTSVAAVVGLSNRVQYEVTNFDGQRVFPGLLENAAQVTEVDVVQNTGAMTFQKLGDQWTLKESGGYPVHGNQVAKVIFSVANLELLEQKTADPKRYDALNLQDPSETDSKAQRVTLKNAAGEVVADLVVGRANYFLPKSTTGGTYIRRPGEDQTWLAKGLIDIGVERRDWLLRDIVDIKVDDVTRVEVRHPDGEVQIVEPMAGVTGDFAFANMPEGRKLKSEYAPRNIAAVVSGFILNDARKADRVPVDKDKAYTATYETKDGIVADLTFWSDGETRYLRVNAKYTGSDTESAAAKQAAEIDARADGWTYIIPDYQYEQIAKPFAEVTEPAEKGS